MALCSFQAQVKMTVNIEKDFYMFGMFWFVSCNMWLRFHARQTVFFFMSATPDETEMYCSLYN